MKIECPNCHLQGEINGDRIPVTGLVSTCPRCKGRFTVERPTGAGAASTLSTCPTCQYSTFSEETFAVCPKCGLDAADYHRQPAFRRAAEEEQQRLERIGQQDQLSRQKHRIDQPLPAPGEGDPVGLAVPQQLQIVGWSTIAAAALVGVMGIKGLISWSLLLAPVDPALLLPGEGPPSRLALFFSHGLIPLCSLGYGLYLGATGYLFLRLRQTSIPLLTWGARAGICLAAMHELTELILWVRRSSDNASIGYYAAGGAGTLVMLLIWVAPLLLLLRYLQSEEFDRVSGLFR